MPPILELEAIRKNQILEAAIMTISEFGSANVTMADICRAASLSKGGLAHYYKSKRELFKAVFEEFFKRVFVRCRDKMAEFDEPLEKLLSLELLYNADDPDAVIGYPILFDFMSIAVHDAEYRQIFRNCINNWIELLSQALIEGQEQGIFGKFDPDSVARSISAIYQGIATRWYMSPEYHSTEWALDTLRRGVKGLLASYDNER